MLVGYACCKKYGYHMPQQFFLQISYEVQKNEVNAWLNSLSVCFNGYDSVYVYVWTTSGLLEWLNDFSIKSGGAL